MRPAVPLLPLLLLGLLLGPWAAAQRLSIGVQGGGAWAGVDVPVVQRGASLTAAVSGWRHAGADVDAWVLADLQVRDAGATAPSTTVRLGVGTAVRHATTFGPLGTVVVEGGAAVATPLNAGAPTLGRVWAGARGTLGGVALSLLAEAGNATPDEAAPGRPAPPDAGGREALRALNVTRSLRAAPAGAWDAGARLSAIYRIDRDVSLGVEATARAVANEEHLALLATLRRARLAPDIDGWLGVDLLRSGGDDAVAVGVGAFHVPRREPASWARLWLGSGAYGVAPGVEALLARRVQGAEVRLQVAWRPWLAPHAWSADASLEGPLGGTTLRWAVQAAGEPYGSMRWQLSVRLEAPLPRSR